VARILLLLVIVFILYLLFRRFFRSQTKDAAPPTPSASQAKGEDMVACSRCGVNLPRSDAREEAGRLVCQNNPNCHP
jgi:hypothetical protein